MDDVDSQQIDKSLQRLCYDEKTNAIVSLRGAPAFEAVSANVRMFTQICALAQITALNIEPCGNALSVTLDVIPEL